MVKPLKRISPDEHIAALQRQITELKAELAEWRQAAEHAFVGADSDTMMSVFNPWKLTTKEMTVLLTILRRRNGSTRDQIMLALYSGQSVDEQPEIKIVDVFVCKMRRKLANPENPAYAVPKDAIKTIWGRGYRVEPEDHKLITDILGYDPSHVDSPETKA